MSSENLSKDLERISSDTMADIVEVRLREFFRKRSYKPGDSLPKELELVAALGVSRNVVREALSRLRMLGMIETRKKRGMILARPDVLAAFERVLDPLIIDDQVLHDLFEMRLIMEMGMVDLLFLRKTQADVAALQEIVMNETDRDDRRFRVKKEIDFHGKLYDITGNNTLGRLQIMLMPVFEYVADMEEFEPTQVTHTDLVNILKKNDKEKFRDGIRQHLKPHFDRLKKK